MDAAQDDWAAERVVIVEAPSHSGTGYGKLVTVTRRPE